MQCFCTNQGPLHPLPVCLLPRQRAVSCYHSHKCYPGTMVTPWQSQLSNFLWIKFGGGGVGRAFKKKKRKGKENKPSLNQHNPPPSQVLMRSDTPTRWWWSTCSGPGCGWGPRYRQDSGCSLEGMTDQSEQIRASWTGLDWPGPGAGRTGPLPGHGHL